MKIAFVADVAYPWHVGGIEIVNYNEAIALSKGHEIDFFSMKWPGMQGEFTKDGIRYHTFHDADKSKLYAGGRRSIGEAFAFSLGLHRLFRYKFDAIISNQFPVLHLPILYLYSKLKKCKLILEVVEVWDKAYWISYLGPVLGRIGSFCYSLTMKGACYYIANSSMTAERLFHAGISRERISVFTPILDDTLVASIPEAKDSVPRTIAFSGRLIKEKRMDKWLDIVKKVNEIVPIKAVIIGNGPERDIIKAKIVELDLSNVVAMKDFFATKKELYQEFNSASAFLLMSEREGLGAVAIESIALGTPAFLPLDSPVPEEVKDMCVVGEEAELVRALADIMVNDKKSRYIRNMGNLDSFRISMVPKLYNGIFSKIDKC